MDWFARALNQTPYAIYIRIAITALVAICIIFVVIPILIFTSSGPASPSGGWASMDYDALQSSRGSLEDYLASAKIDPEKTPLRRFKIATANFGGIYTENMGAMQPWLGTVSAETARLQVEAGARAIVFDIWPDPANPQMPIIASMIDTDKWYIQRMWKHSGLSRGVGRYSNWHKLTRNVGNANEIITTAINTAFRVPMQKKDPFFLILNLHGAMTVEYLNYLGDVVTKAIHGHALSAEWNKNNNVEAMCTAPVSTFLSKAIVIVNPDIQSGYNSLPNLPTENTRDAFNSIFLTTRLGEATNILTTTVRPVVFDPVDLGLVSSKTQKNCNGGELKQSLAETGLCVVQSSIGGSTTANDGLFTNYLNSGAQMVAVNLFSQNQDDKTLTQFFSEKYFGKFSFFLPPS